jgi:hypothetical protein
MLPTACWATQGKEFTKKTASAGKAILKHLADMAADHPNPIAYWKLQSEI